MLLCALCASTPLFAEAVDLYLYYWSDSESKGGDLGQFQTTDDANIVVIDSCYMPAYGIKFSVRTPDWKHYGWKATTVTSTGVDVELAEATGATCWFGLAAGYYDVTFNIANTTIRFDTPKKKEEEDPIPQTAAFLRGGDLSMATYLEDWNIKFRYKDGTAGDVFDILQSYGINLARLRLYHTPGAQIHKSQENIDYRTPVKSPANSWAGRPGYYAGLTDILNLAQRAKAHNMQICLSIYLSDFWSGATEQYIPEAWKNISDRTTLGDSVYNYTKRVMQAMVAQGTVPEYVSIGNESNYGILYTNLSGSNVSFGGRVSGNNYADYITLHNRAAEAIREITPDAKIIVHHSYGDAGKIGICRSFFQALNNGGCIYDIVGGSYYPHWATDHGAYDCTPTGMLEWAQDMETNVGKPVMLMEVGYSWTPYKSIGRNGGSYEGQLHLNGSYNEATESGQEAFIKELHEALKTDPHIVGYMYWDPIFVDQYVTISGSSYWAPTCWAEKYSTSDVTWYEDGNVISNTTLFDFEGKPLSALYNEIASYKEEDTPTAIESIHSSSLQGEERGTLIIRNGQVLILRDGRYYSLLGQSIR